MTQPAQNPFSRAWRVARDNSLLMVTGAAVALAWANLDPSGYSRAVEPLHFAVNDVAMTFFFGLAMKEVIEATAPGGALHSLRRAGLPVLAAVGGMAGPALLYLLLATLARRPDVLAGWAIPTATDIAFSYLVIRQVFTPTHPAVPFLLLLAIADDGLGLVLLAVFYPAAPVRVIPLVALIAASCAIAWWLRARGTRSFWPYIAGAGTVSWCGFYLGGLHPALALVPVLPFLPHASTDAGLFVEAEPPAQDALNAFERWWSTPVEFVLFFFALVNAGVSINGIGTVTWIVLFSLVLGKPLGIAVATWIAERLGFSRAPGLGWRELFVLGTAAGVGFTVALFFATASFPVGAALDQAKLGALLSVSAGVLTLVVARLTARRLS